LVFSIAVPKERRTNNNDADFGGTKAYEARRLGNNKQQSKLPSILYIDDDPKISIGSHQFVSLTMSKPTQQYNILHAMVDPTVYSLISFSFAKKLGKHKMILCMNSY
jgi:hypothetical protein